VPLHTTIPFTLTVITLSKPHPQDYEGELWPSPPHRPEAFKFTLKEDIVYRIRGKRTACITLAQSLGPVQLDRAEKVWLPLDGGQGRWRQEATLKSSLRLQCPPTFTFVWKGKPRLAVSYRLCVKVKFGAIRGLTFEQPLAVVREHKLDRLK